MRTEHSGALATTVVLECDAGIAGVSFSVNVVDKKPRDGEVVFFSSPINAYLDFSTLRSLGRMVTGIDRRVHFVDDRHLVEELCTRRQMTMILQGAGLLMLKGAGVPLHFGAKGLGSSGNNVVFLVGDFLSGTIEVVNSLVSDLGICVLDRRQTPSSDVAGRPPPYYDVDCDGIFIRQHELTKGVRRVYWHRVSPVALRGDASQPLIGLPTFAHEYSAVVARPNGYVVVVGTAPWPDLCCVGWPYANDRLFANLLDM